MDLRTLAFGVGVFCATFLVGWWLNIGGMASGWGISVAKPVLGAALPTEESAGLRTVVARPQSNSSRSRLPQGPGLTDDLIRKSVVSWAKRYQRPPCNQDVRWGYVRAATRYAEALMRSAGCNTFPRCPMSIGQFERVWLANRSARDLPVAAAMAAANAAGGLSERSFRGDVGRAVRAIAGSDFDPGPPPACSSRRTRSWSFRIRRR
jgi:hypothetical protein